jgi:hypothetical protein
VGSLIPFGEASSEFLGLMRLDQGSERGLFQQVLQGLLVIVCFGIALLGGVMMVQRHMAGHSFPHIEQSFK